MTSLQADTCPGYFPTEDEYDRWYAQHDQALAVDGAWAPLWEREFGEGPGHPFRGNQWTGGDGAAADVSFSKGFKPEVEQQIRQRLDMLRQRYPFVRVGKVIAEKAQGWHGRSTPYLGEMRLSRQVAQGRFNPQEGGRATQSLQGLVDHEFGHFALETMRREPGWGNDGPLIQAMQIGLVGTRLTSTGSEPSYISAEDVGSWRGPTLFDRLERDLGGAYANASIEEAYSEAFANGLSRDPSPLGKEVIALTDTWIGKDRRELPTEFGDVQGHPFHGNQWTDGGGGGGVATLAKPITAEEARGNSRAVTPAEFQRLAAEGKQQLETMQAHASPPTGLDQHWDAVKQGAYAELQKSWGGATYDAHTGQAVQPNADVYSLTAKHEGQDTIRIPENASYAEFSAAMDLARREYADQLSWEGGHLGVFHDDASRSIDIDPATLVGTLHEVETIGAYTHAVGGAYRFADGNGYWPPHVESRQEMKHAEWHAQAKKLRGDTSPVLSPDEVQALLRRDAEFGDSSGHPFRGNQWTGDNGAASIPAAPGTTPIPANHVRLYHYTRLHPSTEGQPIDARLRDAAERLRTEGLRIDQAKGETYGEPNIVWASGQMPDPSGSVFAEFHVPMGDPRWTVGSPMEISKDSKYEGKWVDPETGKAYNVTPENYTKTGANVAFSGSIRPDEIIAVHEPWHEHYRYMNDDPSVKAEVKAGFHDNLIDEPGYGPAIRAIKGAAEFGDSSGHPFRGNQYTGGSGGADPTHFDVSVHREEAKHIVLKVVNRRNLKTSIVRVPKDLYHAAATGDVEAAQKVYDIIYPKGEKGGFTSGGEEFGDMPGHPFRGNQWTGGLGEVTQAHQRAEKVEAKLNDLVAKGQTTAKLFDHSGLAPGSYKPERLAMHRQIVNDILARNKDVPRDGKALILGGLPGAGKSSILKDESVGIDTKNYLTLSADDVKAIMIERDMLPDAGHDAGLKPMEMSTLIGDEAWKITNDVAQAATHEGTNVIYDVTMASNEGIDRHLATLQDNQGPKYSTQMIFAQVPMEVSQQRAFTRYGSDVNSEIGGRYIIPSDLQRLADPVWGSQNRRVFEETKGHVDNWQVWDTTSKPPRLLEKS